MPIKLRWFDDTKRIVLWEIEGQWTLDEMHQMYTIGNDMCAEVPENTVNALIDMTHSNAIPSNIFSALSTRTRTGAPNYDMAVIVSGSTMVKSFAGILNAIPALKGDFAVVPSVEAGLAYIDKRRQQLASKIN